MIKEEEIRPQAIFDEYLRLAELDTKLYFTDGLREEINCPSCGGTGTFAIAKSGFTYDECYGCKTIYVNPRPSAQAFSRYYQESASSKYWASTFYKETAAARREKLWKPKAKEIAKVLLDFSIAPDTTVVDIGGGYGIFAEEIRDLCGLNPTIIEPGPELAQICRSKGFNVVEKFLEEVVKTDLPEAPKIFVSFELFEHLHDPAYFLTSLQSLMCSGDLFIFTTLSGTGADIQALWEDSKAISPPHHLNFFNPKSIKHLIERIGFEALKITTPGELDIDILSNNKSFIKDRFWRTFVDIASENEKKLWQQWLVDQGWSSHMWTICRKP